MTEIYSLARQFALTVVCTKIVFDALVTILVAYWGS